MGVRKSERKLYTASLSKYNSQVLVVFTFVTQLGIGMVSLTSSTYDNILLI